MDAPNSISRPIDYRARMAPREQAWKESRAVSIRPQSLTQVSEKSKMGILDKIKTKIPLSISSKNKQIPLTITTHRIISPETAYLRDSKGNSIPSDVISIILSNLNASSLVALKRCTRLWKAKVENYPDFWKKVELEKIQNEFPQAILEAFGGAEKIQKMKFVDLNRGEMSEYFRKKNGKDTIENGKVILSLAQSSIRRITWITQATFGNESLIRGIDPYGCHFICMKVFRGNQQLALIFQEDAPAFRSQRKDKTFGWVVTTLDLSSQSANKLEFYPSPMIPDGTKQTEADETVCIFHHGTEKTLLKKEIIEKIQILIDGGIIETIFETGRLKYSMKPPA